MHLDLDLDLVEQLVDGHHAADLEPGLAYGVVLGGRLVASGGRGVRDLGTGDVPDADTVFRIASMTKSFTASAVLALRDAGRLRLDDEVARYVPQVAALTPPSDDAPPLTVRSLLTMTAGFPTDDPWGDRQQDLPDDDFAALVAGGLSFAWTPGTAFEYSNLGYALLGRVIAAAAGRPYPDVVRDDLLGPLGMAATGWTAAEVAPERLAQGYRRPLEGPDGWQPVPFAGYGSFAAMGGLFSTVRDLARWVGGLAGAFPPRDRIGPGTGDAHPLARASRREQQLPHLALPPTVTWRTVAGPPVVRGVAYGFGLLVERDVRLGTIVGHSGGYPGFGSHMRWHPATGLGVIVLGNATYTPAARLGAQLLDGLLAGWRGDPAPAPARSLAATTAQAREDVTRLLLNWDDELADRLLATNVALDAPLAERRAALAQVDAAVGPPAPDPDAPVTSVSPAHCVWWLRAPRGRVRVEIRLSPESPPRVQTLAVTAVPDPPEAVRRVADQVAELLGAGARPPGDWPEAAAAQLRVGSVWAGRSRVTEVLSADGAGEATFRLVGERCALVLALSLDPATGAVTGLELTPVT